MEIQRRIQTMMESLEEVGAQNNIRVEYRRGTNPMKNLGFSIPHAMNLKLSSGLIDIAIRSQTERIKFLGWKNKSLNNVCDENRFPSLAAKVVDASLVTGVGFVSIGIGREEMGEPKYFITAENPLKVYGNFDTNLNRLTSAIKIIKQDKTNVYGYLFEEGYGFVEFCASKDGSKLVSISEQWFSTNLKGERVPIIAFPNEQSFDGRLGHSDITEVWKTITDSQQRTLMALEYTREFGAFPKYMLFSGEERDLTSGSITSMMNQYNLIANPDARIEKIEQINPQVLTELSNYYNRQFAQVAGLPESYLGLSAASNPTSAEALIVSENRLVNRVTQKIDALRGSFAYLGLLLADLMGESFALDSEDDTLFYATSPSFRNPETPNYSTTVSSVIGLVSAGILSPNGNATFEALGWDKAQIAEVKKDFIGSNASNLISQIKQTIKAEGDAIVEGDTIVEESEMKELM